MDLLDQALMGSAAEEVSQQGLGARSVQRTDLQPVHRGKVKRVGQPAMERIAVGQARGSRGEPLTHLLANWLTVPH